MSWTTLGYSQQLSRKLMVSFNLCVQALICFKPETPEIQQLDFQFILLSPSTAVYSEYICYRSNLFSGQIYFNLGHFF